LLNRMNFALMVSTGLRPGSAERGRAGRGEMPERAATMRVPVPHSRIADAVMANDLSATTRQTVARATSESQKIALLLGSPDFQKR
jgi:uncharacterized protein (DUF1800 family)